MLDLFLTYFLEYQYWVFFAVSFFAAFGFPIPATALILAGGAFYSQGYFGFLPLFLSGIIGSILGDMFGYGISFLYGESIFVRIGLRKVLHSSQFQEFIPSFERNAFFSVLITRFLITGLGPATNILAGITRMKPARFVISDIIGEILYIGLYIVIGYSFGSQWEAIVSLVESFGTMLMSMVLIIIVLYFFWKYSEKTEKKNKKISESV